MQKVTTTEKRREFLRGGLRAIALGSLAIAGISLGWRRNSRSGQRSSCSIDLPCRICSQLPGCREPEALDTKRASPDSKNRRSTLNRGPE